ncbi:hypothetical protein B0J13DRAFT_567421 [Dactylonectria estremocensis]|uniref:Protein kinase domain-containing protein n=1 Tax=Dactylonectria estremocensis TaxID=1079267 RepID=A0A9P9DN20_9HYPO|nr:hypothetical protein B0J13DRAFT_567421 [Dactylonectria estremocensis]
MEYMHLGDLEEFLSLPLSEDEAVAIIQQATEGLVFMHDNDFIHRDLKPRNIFVCRGSPDWWVKLGDFGLAGRMNADLERMGTYGYMAPELVGFGPEDCFSHTSSVDLWALGVLAFRIIVGHLPFPTSRDLAMYTMGDDESFLQELQEVGASGECSDFIRQSMDPSSQGRLTARAAASHSWILDPEPVEASDQFPPQTSTQQHRGNWPSPALSTASSAWSTDPKANSHMFDLVNLSLRERASELSTAPVAPVHDPSPKVPCPHNDAPLDFVSFDDPPAEFTYTSIHSEEIRLLRLERGDPSGRISCGIQVFHLQNRPFQPSLPEYKALSYCWGAEEATHEISVRDLDKTPFSSNGENCWLLIRNNLYDALRCLRSRTLDLWFWIDAICINQADDVEKSHQLPKMLEIYCHADSVSIWLGETSWDWIPTQLKHVPPIHPLDFARSISDLAYLEEMLTLSSSSMRGLSSWCAFANLLKRSWFTRRWVIQEVTASHRATVHCGRKQIAWVDFASAVELFLAHLEEVRLLFQGAYTRPADVARFLSGLECSAAGAIVSATNNLLRKGDDGAILDRMFSAEALVDKFKSFAATDPRDTIYALLPLASDGPMALPGPGQSPHSLIPDYTRPIPQTYAHFVKHCVASTGSLDILCRPWALPVPPTTAQDVLPSWIQLVHRLALQGQTGGMEGESLVGEPGSHIYNVSRNMAARCRFQDSTKRTQRGGIDQPRRTLRLYAKGLQIGTITRHCGPIMNGTIPSAALDIAGWNNDCGSSDRVWRTLVADRDHRGRHSPFWFRSACLHALGKTFPGQALEISRLMTQMPRTVAQYLKRVEAVVQGKKLWQCGSVKQGVSGLGPSDTELGDVLCILFGCSVPVILRPKASASGQYYEFVGECYAHGYMDGEALAGLDEEAILRDMTEFELQ